MSQGIQLSQRLTQSLVLSPQLQQSLHLLQAPILELKAMERVLPIHEAQVLTYLKLSGLKLGLIINFNVKLLRPANGDSIWNYPVTGKTVVKTEFQQNWILVQFDDEVRVVKFFSL